MQLEHVTPLYIGRQNRNDTRMNKLLTIIIPVYRVRDTIERCLRSIVEQQYDNMEIILVDDGSPDECPQICDEWAARDKRITVIHKSNGGLSDARNAGIDIASGEYLTFVDSDDYIEENTYPMLMKTLENHPEYDILEFPVYRFFGSPHRTLLQFADKVYDDMTEYWVDGCAYDHTYAWNKIFRRSLFYDVRFPVGKVFEDVYTLPLLLKHANVVATTSEGLYYYCSNDNGITATAGKDEWRMLLDAHIRVMDEYRNHPMFYRYYMHVVNIQLYEYELTGDVVRLKWSRIKTLDGLDNKARLKAIAGNWLGIKRLCILSKMLNKVAKFH